MKIQAQSPGHFCLHIPSRWEQTRQESELVHFLETNQRTCWAAPEYSQRSVKVTEVILRVLPEIELPALSPKLELPPLQEPNAALVQSHLVDLQQRMAQAKACDTGAEKNQRVTFQAYAEINGVPAPGTARDHCQGLLRNDLIAPGFYRHLLGMKPGEKRSFNFALPSGALTRKVVYHVTMISVESLTALPLETTSEDFPRALGYANWPALVQALHQDLEQTYLKQWQDFVRLELVDSICRKAHLEMPADLFLYESKQLWKAEEGRVLAALGLPESLCKMSQSLWLKDPQKQAEIYQNLKRSLVIQAIAQQEDLNPSEEELLLCLRPFAEHFQQKLSDLYAYMQTQGQLKTVVNQLLSEKVADWLLTQARFYSQGKEIKPEILDSKLTLT